MSLSKITSIISKMPARTNKMNLSKYGKSKIFAGSTKEGKQLPIWNKLEREYFRIIELPFARNGLEDLIILTEEGKLWKYPIDNEQGLEEEQKVPFEEHVFFEDRLQEFPENEYVRSFMQYVLMGLGNNPHMTVKRKHQVIDWYLDYFTEKNEYIN